MSVERARALRSEMSKPEVLLWDALRRRTIGGFKFRRQHPIGPYVLDFFCWKAALAIEVDGDHHGLGDQPEKDARRDSWLLRKGVNTMRIPATEVLYNLEGVFQDIEATLASSSPKGEATRRQPSGRGSTPPPG